MYLCRKSFLVYEKSRTRFTGLSPGGFLTPVRVPGDSSWYGDGFLFQPDIKQSFYQVFLIIGDFRTISGHFRGPLQNESGVFWSFFQDFEFLSLFC